MEFLENLLAVLTGMIDKPEILMFAISMGIVGLALYVVLQALKVKKSNEEE